jgi:hypothetical protein
MPLALVQRVPQTIGSHFVNHIYTEENQVMHIIQNGANSDE